MTSFRVIEIEFYSFLFLAVKSRIKFYLSWVNSRLDPVIFPLGGGSYEAPPYPDKSFYNQWIMPIQKYLRSFQRRFS